MEYLYIKENQLKVETQESFGAGQNWIFSYICYSDKYGNIWKERPIKLVGIHNKQDNWKLPVKRRSYRIQSRRSFLWKNTCSWFS